MRFPKKVKVVSRIYPIKYRARLSSDAGVTGLVGEDTQRIYIDDDIGPDVERETVLHECLHAAWHQTLLDRKFTDEQEEDVLWTLGPVIVGLLRDNPKLTAYLTAK